MKLPLRGRNGDVMALTIGFLIFAFYTWLYLLPVYLKQLGFSDADVGKTFSLLLFLWNGGKLFGGFLADRFGRKPLIIFPGFMSFVGLTLASLVHSPWLIVLGISMDYFASGVQSPAMLAIIAESESELGKAYGRMEAAVALGIAVGPFFGAWLYDLIGIQGLIRLTAFAVLIALCIRSALLVEVNTKRHKAILPKIKLTKEILIFTLALTLMSATFSITIYGPYLSIYEREVLRFSERAINLSFFVGNTFAALAGLGLAHYITQGNYRLVWATAMVFLTGLLALWSHLPLMPIFILSFPFSQFAHVSFMVGMSTFGDDSTRGTLIGLMSSVSGMLGSFSPSLGAYLMKRMGYTGPFDAGLVMALLTAVVILKLNGIKRQFEPSAT